MANRYSKALKHLKNKNIDEKLKLLEQIPTNNTAGIFVDTPGTFEPEEIGPGDLPPNDGLNLVEDGQGQEGYTGNDTTGLFLADGTIKSVEPPGDTSYILGPMMSMWYAWANYTQIGYVRQSDRKMVNLGRITGEMSAWDGETGFTGYGQLSLEQAVWFKGQTRADYRAFYPGPPSNPADEFGRYLGSLISTSKSTQTIIPAINIPGINTSFDPSDVFSSILGLLLGTDDSILTDLFSNSALGTQGLVFLGFLTGQLPDIIGNEFLGQNYVNDSFADMQLDPNGKFSSVGDNVIGSGQYPTYDPTTNEIKVKFNYDFKKNADEFKDPSKEGAKDYQKTLLNLLGPYSADAQPALPPIAAPIQGGLGVLFGGLIAGSKALGGGKQTPGEITISPQQLQQINPGAYNQLVNKGDVPSDAASKPSQNKQVLPDGADIDPAKAIESLKQQLPADQRAQLDFQKTMSMDNFNKLSKSDQNKIMDNITKQRTKKYDGSNYKNPDPYTKNLLKMRAKEAGKTKFKDGYMIDKDPMTGKERRTPIFSTIPGRSSMMVLSHEPKGELLSEDRKRILRDIKKPVKVKEMPTKFKVKPTGRKNKSVGVDMMKIPDVPKQYKPQTNIWGKADYAANVRSSQEKKNEVLELVGAAEHHWTYLTEDRRKKQQEKVNEMMSAEYDKQMELLYEKHRIKEGKLDKAISAFRKPTDIAPEYPKEPPPQLDPQTGMHPKFGKNYKHDKLDPQSAEAMPPTGNPEIDANVKKATNAKEKARKLKILLGKKA